MARVRTELPISVELPKPKAALCLEWLSERIDELKCEKEELEDNRPGLFAALVTLETKLYEATREVPARKRGKR